MYTWEVNKYEEDKEEEYIDDGGDGDITYWAPLYTSSTRVLIVVFMHKTMGLEPCFCGHGFAYDMHNPWA